MSAVNNTASVLPSLQDLTAEKIAADASALVEELKAVTAAPTGLTPSLDFRIASIEAALKRHGIA